MASFCAPILMYADVMLWPYACAGHLFSIYAPSSQPLVAIQKVSDNRPCPVLFILYSAHHRSITHLLHSSILYHLPRSTSNTMLSILGLALAALPLSVNAQDSSDQGQSTVMSVTVAPASSSVGTSNLTVLHLSHKD